MYGVGQALLLLSKYTSPDPPFQWKYKNTSKKKDSSTEEHELSRHTTLSLVMKKDEAVKAEVTIQHIYMYTYK